MIAITIIGHTMLPGDISTKIYWRWAKFKNRKSEVLEQKAKLTKNNEFKTRLSQIIL